MTLEIVVPRDPGIKVIVAGPVACGYPIADAMGALPPRHPHLELSGSCGQPFYLDPTQ